MAAIKAAGGGELYVPPGVWLTTGFALTSHMSVFLEKGATLLAALPNSTAWRPRNESCSSYPARVTCRGNPSSGPGRMDERHSGSAPLLLCCPPAAAGPLLWPLAGAPLLTGPARSAVMSRSWAAGT